MVNLYVKKNIVLLSKKDYGYKKFVNSYLVKYEETLKCDKIGGKRNFRAIKERRELYTEYKDFIVFPRGILDLIPLYEYNKHDSNKSDSLIIPQLSFDEIRNSIPDSYPLRDDQVIAVNKCLNVKRGVIQLPTAVGKSSIIVATIKRLLEVNPNLKALVLAPTLSTVENINRALVYNKVPSKIFNHPDKDFELPVTTALVQSLMLYEHPEELSQINAVFYDECLPAKSRILLTDGTYKAIKDIYEDDSIQFVKSYNLELKCYEDKRIIRKYKTPYDQKFCNVYYIDTLTNKAKGFTCTPNHKIWTKTRGYVPAEELTDSDYIKVEYPNLRDTILDKHSYCKIKSVVLNCGGTAKFKYNIEVEDNHNYFAESVLVSNCHHLKCETWNKLNSLLPNVEYALGFSALSIDKREVYETDFRNISYESALIIGSAGRVLMHMDPAYYIEKGIIALPIVFRIAHSHMFPANLDESDWRQVVKYGLMSSVRTNKVAEAAHMFSKYNRKTLILVAERDYAFVLAKFLVQLGETKFGISFGAGQGYIYKNSYYDEFNELIVDYDKIQTLDVLDKLSNDELNIVIGTQHIDEGIDIAKLDAVILAFGGKKDRRIVQRTGRVLRKSKTGKYAYVIDFTDVGSKVLSRQSNSRLNMYKKDIGVPLSNIYDGIPIENIENKFKELEQLI